MAVNQYIILSNTGNIIGGKRLYVLWDTYQDKMPQKRKAKLTLNAKSFLNMGARGREISFKALFQHTPSDAAYFSKAQLDAYRTATTIAANKLKFQDIYGTQFDAAFVELPEFTPEMVPLLEGTDGWWSAQIQLVILL